MLGIGARQRIEFGLDAAARGGFNHHDRETKGAPQNRRLETEVLDAIEWDASFLAVQQAFANAQLFWRQRVFERQVAHQRVAQLHHEQAQGRNQEPRLDRDAEDQREGNLTQCVKQS